MLLTTLLIVFSLLIPRPPSSTLFPYTTLFRSDLLRGTVHEVRRYAGRRGEVELGLRVRVDDQFPRAGVQDRRVPGDPGRDRKSTRLNSSHQIISYAVFCLKKKKKNKQVIQTAS